MNKRQSARSHFKQYGGYLWMPKSLVGVIDQNHLLILSLLLDQEDNSGQGFFLTITQLVQKTKLNRKTIIKSLDFIKNDMKVLHKDQGGKFNKNYYYIVDENLIKWLEDPHAELAEVMKNKQPSDPKLGTTESGKIGTTKEESELSSDPKLGTTSDPKLGTTYNNTLTRETEQCVSIHDTNTSEASVSEHARMSGANESVSSLDANSQTLISECLSMTELYKRIEIMIDEDIKSIRSSQVTN